MKAPAAILTALVLMNCSSETAPLIAPEPPIALPPQSLQAWLWGMIIDDSGACIPAAKIEVVSGQAQGRTVVQTPCDYWAYGGGFVVDSLTLGLEMTVRVTASGYREETLTVLPGGPPWGVERPLVIWLTKE